MALFYACSDRSRRIIGWWNLKSEFDILAFMNKYDLTVLIKSDLKETAREKFVEKMEALVLALDGKIGKITEMGKKQLAYTIKKQREAQFLSWVLELPSKSVVQLEKKLINDKEVLRHLVICLHDR